MLSCPFHCSLQLARISVSSTQPYPSHMCTSSNVIIWRVGGKGWYWIVSWLGYMCALDKPSFIHGWKYKFVYVKRMNRDRIIPICRRWGLNKTWNMPRTTLREKKMATMNYFRRIDSIHPWSGKAIKVSTNWLPRRVLFSYRCYLCAIWHNSAIRYGKFIIVLLIWSVFSLLALFIWSLLLADEAIDILFSIKGKMTKEDRRHLDDARREKQVRQHVI